MACPGIPTQQTPPTNPCSTYVCEDKSTNPPGISCVTMQYIIAPHYLKNGSMAVGTTGAYVPAITVCSAQIVPLRLSQLASRPDYPYFTS